MAGSQDYATHLRTLFTLTLDTARFSGGRDQHRLIVNSIRTARDLGTRGTDLDQATGSGMTAALAWNMHVFNERGPAAVVDHINGLSPWEFCQFLADVTDANPRTAAQQTAYFEEMAAQLEAAGPTVWLIVSGQDHYPEYIEQVIVGDEQLALHEFDKRALAFEVVDAEKTPDGGIKYRNGTDYIAVQAMTATTRPTT